MATTTPGLDTSHYTCILTLLKRQPCTPSTLAQLTGLHERTEVYPILCVLAQEQQIIRLTGKLWIAAEYIPARHMKLPPQIARHLTSREQIRQARRIWEVLHRHAGQILFHIAAQARIPLKSTKTILDILQQDGYVKTEVLQGAHSVLYYPPMEMLHE